MRKLNIVWLCGLLAACSGASNPLSSVGPTGNSSERVTALGAPPNSTIGPGAGTGTLPTVGQPNSCPTDRPVVSVNSNNNKTDFSVTRVAGQTRSYEWEIERVSVRNVYVFHGRLFSDAHDGRGGLYAQPPTLPEGDYRVRARALRTGCGAQDHGTWSEWQPFSVYGFTEDAGSVACVYVGYGRFEPNGCKP